MSRITARVILAILLLTSAVVIIYHQIIIDRYATDHGAELQEHHMVLRSTPIMLLMVALLLAYITEVFLRNYSIATPISAFAVIIGFLWGIIVSFNPIFRLASGFMKLPADEVMAIYSPVIMFNIAFCLDVPIFLKTLPQSFVIGFPVFIVTATIYGIMAREIINPEWSSLGAVVFGIISGPIYPKTITVLLKQHSSKTKQIAVLLEAEALFTLITADAVKELALSGMVGFIAEWYQFLAVLIRFIVGAVFAGFLFGKLGAMCMRKMYTHKFSMMIVSFALPLAIYALTEKVLGGLGIFAVAISGAMLGLERTTLPKETESFLVDFWETIGFVLDMIICIKSAMLAASSIIDSMHLDDYFLSVATFFLYMVVRFLSFLLFSSIISRVGYGMDLRGMLVCAWGGLKSPFSLEIVKHLEETIASIQVFRQLYFYILMIYFYSHMINGSFTSTLLGALDLTRISNARRLNMNSCMKHVFTKRERTIHILKHDRFLADVNWPIVVKATNVQHPYRGELSMQEDEVFFLGYRFTYCSDCKKDVPLKPTAKEFKEMMREAKIRVLKSKKMSYSRQYEHGMISKEGIRILNQAVELAADSNDAEIKVEDLYGRFSQDNWLQRFVRNRLQALTNKKSKFRPPRTYWRRLCYHLVVTGETFIKIMLLVVSLNAVFIGFDFYVHSSTLTRQEPVDLGLEVEYVILALMIVFALVYTAEVIIKVLAYSYPSICRDGVRIYFKSLQNIFDFVVLLGSYLHIHHSVTHLYDHPTLEDMLNDKYNTVLDILEVARFVRLLRVFDTFYPDLIRHLDRSAEKKRAFTYELGKSYATTESEILDMLPYMIDNKEIREDIHKKMEKDKAYITKLLGLVQKEKPWIAITVKTKQAIRTILNGMSEAINFLKTSGWVDLYEYDKLMTSMEDLYKNVNSIKKVHPSPPKVIFKEVAWMAEDEQVIDFLFENVTAKVFEPGQVVFTKGMVADGIYIVVTGLFMITYTPDNYILEALRDYGRLPIVDYLSGTKYDEPSVDYIVSGNCIGELSTLTGRSYNCTITADSLSQVYVLSRGVLKRAMELSPDPAVGLESRIWKEVSVRIAIPLLLATPAYQTFLQDQIKFALERAFVPDLSRFNIFTVTDVIEDIILIEGVVVDFNTREYYIAPRYIPRTVQKLILPTSSLMKLPIDTETKILIIPSKDVDEVDVMQVAEENCEMVRTGSSARCLQHSAQQVRRRKRRMQKISGSTHSSRNKRLAALTSSIGASVSQYTGEGKSTIMSYRNERSEVGSVAMMPDTYSVSSASGAAVAAAAAPPPPPPRPPAPPRGRRTSLFFQ